MPNSLTLLNFDLKKKPTKNPPRQLDNEVRYAVSKKKLLYRKSF